MKNGAFCAIALFAASIMPSAAVADDHPDKIIAYITCDGTPYSASWSGNGFFHTPQTGGSGHFDTIIRYRAWDNKCWQATWNAKHREFFHHPLEPGGADHADYVINYITWGGSKWTAFRADDINFYHIGPR